jgi:hypothetical protein
MSLECDTVKLASGTELVRLYRETDTGPVLAGCYVVERGGWVRIWQPVWTDTYRPTSDTYPTVAEAERAIEEGEV